jgi:hypothetical protein
MTAHKQFPKNDALIDPFALSPVWIVILALLVGAFALPRNAAGKGGILPSSKLRLIVLTDINPYPVEPDDAESLIRLLLYSNQIDIEAIITTPSWVAQTVDESSYQRILAAVHAYGQVQSNLAVHASGYPTEQYLMNRVKHGTPNWSMANVGAGKSNEGSNFIISIVDNTNDSRHVWIATWTGLTTLAQALYDVQATRTPAEVEAFASRITVYDIDSQDNCGAWIMHNFPSVKFLCSDWQFWGISTATDGTGRIVGDPVSFSDVWVHTNIQNRGPLGAAYPNRVYNFETDSPSFMYMILNGLNDPDEQNWGGWGGRFSEYLVLNPPKQSFTSQDNESYRPYYGYRDEADTYTYNGTTYTNSMFAPVARWKTAFQNEMATRMIWSTNANYSGCNHSPVAVLNDDKTQNILTINSNPGQTVNLNAVGSSDPDGDALSYKWYVYTDPTSYKGVVAISNAFSANATVMVPNDATNDSIHMILEVTDNGVGFPLTSYRRAIIRTGYGGVALGTAATINDGDMGTNDNQFEYVGSWGVGFQLRCHEDDLHVGGTVGDYFNVRFNGTRIKLYGAITFSLGTALAQIDDGPATLVSFYGATPEGAVLLYDSRALPPGQHVLKVSPNGDGYIAPDKAIVYSIPTTPTNLCYSITTSTLTLTWPADYLGWSLQVQTNSAGAGQDANWHTLSGSEFLTTTNVPFSPDNFPLFYRMKLQNE